MRRFGLAGIAAMVAATALGCANERPAIDRVQPQALPKSFFIGANFHDPSDDPEFYARTMIIDVPYGAGDSLYTNGENNLSRIKWEIQENQLIGRVTYERIVDSDGKGKGPTSTDGEVAYVFKILSHFDIRRDYNPTTGEETNVLVENSNDRPWAEREYMRVDWTQNLNTSAYNLDTLAMMGLYGAVSYENIAYEITDPRDPNAPVFDLDNGYFDATSRLFAKPQMINFGDFSWPACMLPNFIRGGVEPVGICNNQELTVRHSFRRVVDKDYEPMDWDGYRFQAFGPFDRWRYGYDRNYGLTDNKWHRFIARYNIWERSHVYTDPDKLEGPTVCASDADCADVGTEHKGSKCDTFKNRCTLPYRDRVEKPIVWHYGDGGQPEYFAPTREAAEEWDTAMRIAVDAARIAECKGLGESDCGSTVDGMFADEEDAMALVKEINACKRGELPDAQGEDACNALADELGQKRGYSAAVVELAKKKPMLIFCNSPVQKGEPAECGAEGTIARLGDLRYNLVTSIAAPQTNSPWGIMTDADDPVSGEKVAASVNIWTYVNNLWAQGAVDVARYIAGELSTAQITEGTYVNDWVAAAKTAAATGSVTAPMAADELERRLAAAGNLDVDAFHRKANPAAVAALKKRAKELRSVAYSATATSTQEPIYKARIAKAAGSNVEAQLATPAMKQLSAFAPTSSAFADPVGAASPLRGLSPTFIRELQRTRELEHAKRGICVMDPSEATAPLGNVQLSNILQQKFGKFNPNDKLSVQMARAEKMTDYLRRRVQYAVIAHEMGHSIGLRHNFVSSSDAYNYRPQYWQLRTNDKATTTECTAPTTDGTSCVGPRRFDPVTKNESDNLITMFMHSSTMEYPGETTQDLLALGGYDFGAARAFYGDVATVFANIKASDSSGKAAIGHQSEFGGILGLSYTSDGQTDIHYSQLDAKLNLISNCKPVSEQNFKPVTWDDSMDGTWNPVLDGHIVSNEQGKYTRCKQQKVDFMPFSKLVQPGPGEPSFEDAIKPFTAVADKNNAPVGLVRVPYGFATDDWADLGNLSVFRHDNGADAYELMQFWISQQEVSHIFQSYRRGRADFDPWAVVMRSTERYHEKMRDAAKGVGLIVNQFRDGIAAQTASDDPDAVVAEVLGTVPDYMIASSIAFDHFTHVFARPQPGPHAAYVNGGDDGALHPTDGLFDLKSKVMIPNGVTGGYGLISLGGRPLESALSNNHGEYDRDYLLNVGSYYEKAFIPMMFAESADNFISSAREDFYDPRFRAVSFADVFPDGFRRWLANNLTGDEFIKGVRVKASGGSPIVDSNTQYPQSGLGWTSWWPKQGVEACFPGTEQLNCRTPSDTAAPAAPGDVAVIDPQVGWEQQKFAIAMTLAYLGENQKRTWIDQIGIVELGQDGDPGFANRIEFHDPSGKVYIAKTMGTETLFGKTVQKGISARVLEYANQLLVATYKTTSTVTPEGFTRILPVLNADGSPQLLKANATCGNVPTCVRLQNYVSVPAFIRESMWTFGFYLEFKGLY